MQEVINEVEAGRGEREREREKEREREREREREYILHQLRAPIIATQLYQISTCTPS